MTQGSASQICEVCNDDRQTYQYHGEYPTKFILCKQCYDVKLGEIGGVPFYMNDDQYEKWKHTDLTIDAVKGIGGMFSLDNGTGQRFLTKSEICLVVDNDKKN